MNRERHRFDPRPLFHSIYSNTTSNALLGFDNLFTANKKSPCGISGN